MNKRVLEQEFEQKFELYGKMLYKIAFLYLGNSTDAEDVLQDVFVKYLNKKIQFKDEQHEKAWFIRVTQNNCKDLLKRSEHKNSSLDSVSLKEEQFFKNDETKIDVYKKLLMLEPKYKSVIVLYYYQDFTVAEISKALKISESAVKMRLKRGREILKLELEDYI